MYDSYAEGLGIKWWKALIQIVIVLSSITFFILNNVANRNETLVYESYISNQVAIEIENRSIIIHFEEPFIINKVTSEFPFTSSRADRYEYFIEEIK